ncbi:hypothetical protein F2Q70_00038760 [Brassica cretica]|uniref:Uncharacterized protein n=1 Tax=Brassica cretica TaxID=69181 RepID=A0A8S9K6Z2_BRACR|nr:hypothetical protein F2Q70_00038760 [Brassica cretica]
MLLANCSTNLFGTVSKERIDPLDHCKAGPIKVDMRSLVPSYILILGKENFLASQPALSYP